MLRALKVTTRAIHTESADHSPSRAFSPRRSPVSTSELQKRRVSSSGVGHTDPPADHSSHSRVASPAELSGGPTDASFSVSVMRAGDRRESILFWDEVEDDFNIDEESERDLKIDELEKQQGVVAQYLDTVDEVLFGGGKGDVRGWASEQERLAHREKGRRPGVPTPDSDFSASPAEALEEEHDDIDGDDTSSWKYDYLPRWAQHSASRKASSVGPMHCFPSHLPNSPDRTFLNALSSGQLLCVAYNIGVRQSRKPWGYINDDSIHDIVALEDVLSASAVDGSQAEKGRKS
ncbi:hypothetical protein DFH94DRAFT_804475 [Russula ochroleuca]|uniref:Uncharacterized protein n=1 Tax=Russula ochroleuca TaxID=152965 RepID=A0A9P5MRW7_9AGAM|nr:hypothetical protein DFH94DRAFT_804475 [Russula ochroleuca]